MDVMQSMAVFRRVVETGSFSAVARESHMSQPTVSKHVAALEQRLGTKLLVRSTRQLNLTEAGTEYYHYCVRILNDFQEAEASVGKGRIKPTGTLRLSTTVALGKHFIIPFLDQFLRRYPDINIDYIMDDRYIDLVKEGIDLAIRVGPMEDCSLIARNIASSKRLLIASPNYLLQHGFPKLPDDLQQHQCLLYSLDKTPTEWQCFDVESKAYQTRINGRFKASSYEAICEAALAGLGIASMCEWHVREHIKKGRLTHILKNYTLEPYDINAVYPERRYVPLKVKRFIDSLREAFDKPGAEIKV